MAASSRVADLRAVFTFACTGKVPEGMDAAATETVRFLAAAKRLKDLRLPTGGGLVAKGGEQEERHAGEEGASLKRRRAGSAEAEVVAEACELIRSNRFGHEHVGDSRLLRYPEVWGALLQHMPMTALMRNLGRMTSIGALDDKARVAKVVQQLTNEAAVRAARLHPISLLEAMGVYGSGRGAKGGLSWRPDPAVTSALELAFYLSFQNVERTGLNWLVGVDVSGSMCSRVCGMTLTARDAAAAMTMALLRSEAPGDIHTMAFCHKLRPLPLHAGMSLEQVRTIMADMDFGSTDCSKPMRFARRNKIEVDVFVVMTDNETYAGSVHPKEALRRYRQEMNRPHAKLIVLAFSATEFSIADPEDPLMMDVAGLDPTVPRIIHDFAVEGMHSH